MKHPAPSQREGFVTSIALDEDRVPSFDFFPFTVPAIRHLGELTLHPAVTFLIGENGSGKSTLLEALATHLGFPDIGGGMVLDFNQRPEDGGLHDAMRVTRSMYRRPSSAFFMRAETVFDFATEVDKDPTRVGFYGGVSLHQRSHGEAFLAIVQNRLLPESLFLMDEPEAALSPARQLTFLKEMDWLVRSGCQFIIATHSPIILAYPDADIYVLGDDGLTRTPYHETEHYQLTRSFLERPAAYLRHLITPSES